MKKVIFYILGLIGLINQLFGILFIFLLLALLIKAWITIGIIFFIYLILDIWRHKDFEKQGKKAMINGELQNTNVKQLKVI